MYNLKILKNGTWFDADMLSDSEIAITYQAYDVGDTKIKGNGSQKIKLPRTGTNDYIFSCIAHGHAGTSSAYATYPCALLEDTIPLLSGQSTLFVLSADDTSYSVVVIGGEMDAFSALKGIDLTSVENENLLGTWIQERDIVQTSKLSVSADGWLTPNSTDEYGHKPYAVAGIHVRTVIDKLAKAAGLTGDKRPNDWEDFELIPKGRVAIPWYRDMEERYSYEIRPANWNCHVVRTLLASDFDSSNTAHLNWLDIGSGTIGVRIHVEKSGQEGQPQRFNGWFQIYRGNSNYETMFTISCGDEDYLDPAECGWKNLDSSHIYRDMAFWDGTKVATRNYQMPNVGTMTQVAGHDEFMLRFNGLFPSRDFSYFKVEILVAGPADDDKKPIRFGKYSFANNLGWKTGLDALKNICLAFGVIPRIRNGYLDWYSMRDVLANKSHARDWTDFVVNSDSDFHSAFAQHNIVKFTENSVTGEQLSYDFPVPDSYLDKEKVYAEVAVETYAYVEYDSASNETPHAMSYWDNPNDQHVYEMNEPKNPYLHSLEEDELYSWLWLDYFYRDLFGTAQYGYRQVTIQAILPVTEILAFDNAVPIFLRQFGKFFYVQKISNWISGKPCSIDLIQI